MLHEVCRDIPRAEPAMDSPIADPMDEDACYAKLLRGG